MHFSNFNFITAKVSSLQSVLDQNAAQLSLLERKVSETTLEVGQVLVFSLFKFVLIEAAYFHIALIIL